MQDYFTKVPLSDFLEMWVINLDKVEVGSYDNSRLKDLIEFLNYLKAPNEEARKRMEKKGKIFQMMNERVEKVIQTDLDPNFFDHDMWNQRIAFEEGWTKGEKNGEKKGEKRGIDREKKATIESLVFQGFDNEMISKTVRLDIDKVESLRLSMKRKK